MDIILLNGGWCSTTALFVLAAHAKLGKCFLIQPNYTLQAKVNLLSPKCPSPPSFALLCDKTEGVKSLYLNVGQFAFHCVGNSSCRATDNTKHLI